MKWRSSTLESGINIPLRLLIFGFFSRGYGLIADLKNLNFTAQVCIFQGATFILFVSNLPETTFFQGATLIPESRLEYEQNWGFLPLCLLNSQVIICHVALILAFHCSFVFPVQHVLEQGDLDQMEPKVILLSPSEGRKLVILLHST